ncbi:MAG: V-type ATP synthase subunit D, partial [Calditrichia bacterium]|nr:V-type ATP synthase subunit D [Calditrichia bacterium]
MAKIKLTKNELKKQKDNLKRFTRYLPTLELKKRQLLQEISTIQKTHDRLQAEFESVDKEVYQWVDVFAEDVDLQNIIKVKEVKKEQSNIAGIDIPIFKEVIFEDIDYDFLQT